VIFSEISKKDAQMDPEMRSRPSKISIASHRAGGFLRFSLAFSFFFAQFVAAGCGQSV
jgi:hypothetical protein